MLFKLLEKYYDKPFVFDLLAPVAAEEDIYLLSDGSVGQMWEIHGVNCDGKSSDEMQKASNMFANFIRVLPEDAPMQIINLSWQGIEDEALQNYTRGDLSDPYLRSYMERKIAWHNKCKHKGFAKEGTTCFYPRSIRTFLTIKQNPLNLGGIGLYDKQTFAKTKQKLKNTTTVVETSLSSGNIGFKRIGINDLISILYKILNPERALDIDPPRYNGGDIRKYFSFTTSEAHNDGWDAHNTRYNVISLANNPSSLNPKTANNGENDESVYTFPNILFRELNGECLYDLIPTMLFTINFYVPSQAALSNALSMKKSLSFLHRMNFIGEEAIDKGIAMGETKKLLTAMYGGEKVVKASYHVCVPTSVEESDFTTSRIISRLNVTTNCNAFQEDMIASGIFMRCLPFGFDQKVPNEEKIVRRAVTATSSNLADIAPIYRSGRGVRTDKAVGYYNRRGEDNWLDLFDKDTAITSAHTLITGATGAGKSVTAVDFIHQALRQPATVIVIDKGESYKRLCMLKKGQYLKFEGETNFKLDPFIGNFDADHRAFLVALLSNMVTGGYESITREEVAAISEAVLQVTNAGEEKSIGNVCSLLKAYQDRISIAVARKLFPFYGKGQYAGSIEGDKPSLELSNPLTVFELGDVDMHKDYQAVIIFLLIYYITEFVKKTPGSKYLFIDEAWSLFKNEVSVDFLVKAVKTFRKYGVSVVFLTQQLDDFSVIARAINMKDNCPNKILLYQEPEVILKNAEQLDLNQGEIDLYKTIKKGKYYAEALLKTQQWTSVGRISLDPESYWVVTTSDPDKELLNRLTNNDPKLRRRASDPSPMTLEEAIKYAAEKYPYGVK